MANNNTPLNIKRQPAGSPVGGRFAPKTHAKGPVVIKPAVANLTGEQIEAIREQAKSVYASKLSKFDWCKRNISSDDFQQLVYLKIATSSRDFSEFSVVEMTKYSRTASVNAALSLMRKYSRENYNTSFDNSDTYQPQYVDKGHELIKNQDSDAKMGRIKGWWSFAERAGISPRVKHHTSKELTSINHRIHQAGGREKLLEGWGNQPTSALKRAEESFCSLFESKEDARTAMRYIAENSIMWKWLEDASSIPDEKQADLFDSEY